MKALSGESAGADLPRGILTWSEALAPEVFRFQRQAYPSRRPDWIEPRWRWMFLGSAERLGVAPFVWVYRNRAGVVAHQGAIAVRVRIGGREHVTGWFVETMALESVRGKAIGPMLVAKARADLPFNLSLGQTPQMRELQFKLGWTQVTPLDTYVYVLNAPRVLAGKIANPVLRSLGAMGLTAAQRLRRGRGRRRPSPRHEARPVARFGPQHDRLWERVGRQYPCAVIRDASYLNWKYVDQPGQDFRRIELALDGTPVGVAALLVSEPDDVYRYRRGFIVDLVVPPEDPNVVQMLLNESVEALRRAGADLVVFDLAHPKLARCARAFGFTPRGATRYFLISTEGLDAESQAAAENPDNWLITMGDSDIDRPW
jgi:hypothetical protein